MAQGLGKPSICPPARLPEEILMTRLSDSSSPSYIGLCLTIITAGLRYHNMVCGRNPPTPILVRLDKNDSSRPPTEGRGAGRGYRSSNKLSTPWLGRGSQAPSCIMIVGYNMVSWAFSVLTGDRHVLHPSGTRCHFYPAGRGSVLDFHEPRVAAMKTPCPALSPSREKGIRRTMWLKGQTAKGSKGRPGCFRDSA